MHQFGSDKKMSTIEESIIILGQGQQLMAAAINKIEEYAILKKINLW